MARSVLQYLPMGTLRACALLRSDHDVITQLLDGLDVMIACRRAGRVVPASPVSGAVEFFSSFVHRCHDAKEDEGVFPHLEARGAPDSEALATLRAEHAQARGLLATLRPPSRRCRVDGEVWSDLETYAALLRRHVATENRVLLPLAERVLSPDDDASIERAFDRIERRVVGPDGRDALLALGRAVTHACRAAGADPTGARPAILARDIMHHVAARVAPEDNLARAADLMDSLGSREVPVVAGRTLIGILTRTDMEPHRGHYEWTAVQAAMTPNPVTVPADAPIGEVANLLLERGFNSVPVTSGEELRGMIARRDVLRVLARDP